MRKKGKSSSNGRMSQSVKLENKTKKPPNRKLENKTKKPPSGKLKPLVTKATKKPLVPYKGLELGDEGRAILRMYTNRPAEFGNLNLNLQTNAAITLGIVDLGVDPNDQAVSGGVLLNDEESASKDPATLTTTNPQNNQNNFTSYLSQQVEEDLAEEALLNISVDTQTTIIPKMNAEVQCTPHETDLNFGFQQGVEKKYSKSRIEYIRKKFKNNCIVYSAELILKLDNSEKLFVKVHGSENLLTANKGDFLAKVHVCGGRELDFRQEFKDLKSTLYSRYIIIKIFQDELLDQRKKAHSRLYKILKERVQKIFCDRDCAEDILQISHIISQAGSNTNTYLLKEIISNRFISTALKRASEQLLKDEENLLTRNKALPPFDNRVSVVVNDLHTVLKEVYEDGINKHREHLTKKYPSGNLYLYRQLATINSLPTRNLLYISSSDITIFSDLHTIYKQRYPERETIIQTFIDDLWKAFRSKLENVRVYEAVQNVNVSINPVFVFLFKSFLELLTEICSITKKPVGDMFYKHEEKIRVPESINFPESSPINNALGHQYLLIFKLLEFYHPKKYSPKNKFTYDFKIKDKSFIEKWITGVREMKNLPKERLVWLYILDCGLSNLLPENTNENILKLSRSLFTAFTKYIKETEYDRFESFRVATHNIIKFAANICPYVSASNELDHKILEAQIRFISDMLAFDDSLAMDHLPDLIVVYNEYWKSRDSIVSKIVGKCSCVAFEDELKNGVFLKLLEVVETALSKKVTVQVMCYFLRLYNEFLEHFKSLKFEWLVSVSSMEQLNDHTFPFCHIVNETAKSFEVSEPDKFIEDLKLKGIAVPKHYFIELIKKLLDAVRLSLLKEDWSNGDQLKAAGDLFLAIGHSLVHFKDQADYIDFESFLNDCSLPFKSVIANCSTYEEFKTRLDNVENFYLYTRKQSEIFYEKAIDACDQNSASAQEIGFLTNINKTVLKKSYEKYNDKFTSLVNTNIEDIISDLRTQLKDVPKINKWTPEFKQDKIPCILANLAAVWTILESEDVVGIGKKIKPHCVQILCILRLLSVDSESNAVNKHLSQVLTGQGKSIILGLLSALLAVTGHYVDTVCYSKYLTNRDAQAFSKFFAQFNEFGVRRRINYSMIAGVANNFICPKINGGEETLRSLVRKLILNEFPEFITQTNEEERYTILLVDEVDVFFSEKFYGDTYNACTLVNMPALLEIQPQIWDIVEEDIHDPDIVLEIINDFIQNLLEDPRNNEFRVFFENTSSYFRKQLKAMITVAIQVSNSKEMDIWYINNFKINNEGLITYKDSEGYYRTDLYNTYYNIFNYFRLKKRDFEHKNYDNYGYLHVSSGHVSYAKLPSEYSLILGVSGVLTTLMKSEIEAIKSYDIDTMTVMPSFFGDKNSKFRFNRVLNFTIEKTEDSWLEKIYNNVNVQVENGRPVLVFFETEKEIEMFEKRFRDKINRLHILTGNEEPSILEEYINKAGLAETVTLATRTMGRGVDYKSNDLSVEEKVNGGTHVVQTFFSLDEKEEIQIKGRTARKDNKGSYELIICKKNLEDLECHKTEEGKDVTSYTQLCTIRKTKSDMKGVIINEKIKKSEKKHKLTMDFLKSFYDFNPERRNEYFSCYPFVETDELDN